MNLKKLQKQKIIDEVFKGQNDTDWSVLVYDKEAAKVMTNLFTQSELITHNIVIAQRIEEVREKAEFPVVYFLFYSKETEAVIRKDLEAERYLAYTACFLNEFDLAHEAIQTKRIFMDFTSLEDKLFISSILGIHAVAKTLGIEFYVEYTDKRLQGECEALDSHFEGEDRKGKVLVFDRSIDPYTPLLHFFTFQALLEDLEVMDMEKIYNDFGDTRLWREVRYAHLGELNDIFKTYAHDVSANMKKLEGEVNTKELMKMVLSAPETLKTNEMLRLFFDLAERCYDSFGTLKPLIEIEQTVATGMDKAKRKARPKVEDVLGVLEDKRLDREDKMRLLYLLKLNGFNLGEEGLDKLSKMGLVVGDPPVEAPFKYDYKFEYEVSRFEPTVSVVVREYLLKKKKLIDFFRLQREANPIKSLRKTQLLSVKPGVHKKKVYIVYIKGGVSYAELASIQKLTDLIGCEFVVGSDRIIKARDVIKAIGGEEWLVND